MAGHYREDCVKEFRKNYLKLLKTFKPFRIIELKKFLKIINFSSHFQFWGIFYPLF